MKNLLYILIFAPALCFGQVDTTKVDTTNVPTAHFGESILMDLINATPARPISSSQRAYNHDEMTVYNRPSRPHFTGSNYVKTGTLSWSARDTVCVNIIPTVIHDTIYMPNTVYIKQGPVKVSDPRNEFCYIFGWVVIGIGIGVIGMLWILKLTE